MITRVQKWGNSLALRIPKALAAEARLAHDVPVELSLIEGKVVVTPIAVPEVTLEGLLAQVTDDNIHHEVDTGPAVGNEGW